MYRHVYVFVSVCCLFSWCDLTPTETPIQFLTQDAPQVSFCRDGVRRKSHLKVRPVRDRGGGGK